VFLHEKSLNLEEIGSVGESEALVMFGLLVHEHQIERLFVEFASDAQHFEVTFVNISNGFVFLERNAQSQGLFSNLLLETQIVSSAGTLM